MKANPCLWTMLLLLRMAAVAEQPFDFVWAQNSGGFPNKLAVDGEKNTFVCGYFSGIASFGSTCVTNLGNSSAFLAKYNSQGSLQWVRTVGGAASTLADAGAVTVGGNAGIYIAGRFVGTVSFGSTNLTSATVNAADLFFVKYDTNGTVIWVKQFPGQLSTQREVTAAAIDGAENIYLAGDFQTGATFGAFTLSGNANGNVFLAKFDLNGNCLWARAAGGSLGTYAQDLAIDASGNPILTGHFQGSGSFGTNNLISAGSWDVFLLKYNSLGDVTWVRQAGGGGDDYGYGVASDSGGNIFTVGMFRNVASFGGTNLTSVGYHDGFVARYSSNGLMNWVHPVRGQSGEDLHVFSVRLDPSGNALLVGEFKASADFGVTNLSSSETGHPQFFGDIYAAKCSSAGEFLWAMKTGGSSFDSGRCIVCDATGSAYVAGYFSGTVNFGQTNLASTGAGMFLGKLDVIPSPAALSLQMYAGLLIQGTIGGKYAIQFVSDLSQTNDWQTLVTIEITNSSQLWIDLDSPNNSRRFYRTVP